MAPGPDAISTKQGTFVSIQQKGYSAQKEQVGII